MPSRHRFASTGWTLAAVIAAACGGSFASDARDPVDGSDAPTTDGSQPDANADVGVPDANADVGASDAHADVGVPDASVDGGSADGSPPDAGDGALPAPPMIVGLLPADGTTGVPLDTSAQVTFDSEMLPSSLVAQTAAGACSASFQLSADEFATCMGFSSSAPALSVDHKVAWWDLELAPGTTYRLRVTTQAESAGGVALAQAFTMAAGFTTVAPPVDCDGVVVISQVYGGGGNAAAPYVQDFVELKNLGTSPVDLTGWSLQYASAPSQFWSVGSLEGTIPAGGYFLVGFIPGFTGAPLPTPDWTGLLNLSSTSGKVALTDSTDPLTGSCPTSAALRDFVGYGIATCFEGTSTAPSASNTLSVQRLNGGCTDTDDNAADFLVAPPTPRNSAATPSPCWEQACSSD